MRKRNTFQSKQQFTSETEQNETFSNQNIKNYKNMNYYNYYYFLLILLILIVIGLSLLFSGNGELFNFGQSYHFSGTFFSHENTYNENFLEEEPS